MLNITRLYDMIFIKKYYTFMTTRKKRIMNNVCDTSALITFCDTSALLTYLVGISRNFSLFFIQYLVIVEPRARYRLYRTEIRAKLVDSFERLQMYYCNWQTNLALKEKCSNHNADLPMVCEVLQVAHWRLSPR